MRELSRFLKFFPLEYCTNVSQLLTLAQYISMTPTFRCLLHHTLTWAVPEVCLSGARGSELIEEQFLAQIEGGLSGHYPCFVDDEGLSFSKEAG